MPLDIIEWSSRVLLLTSRADPRALAHPGAHLSLTLAGARRYDQIITSRGVSWNREDGSGHHVKSGTYAARVDAVSADDQTATASAVFLAN